MPISFASKACVPSGILMEELQGEGVFLNTNSGMYFGLNEAGTRMWRALTTAPSIQAALDSLQAEYDVEPSALKKDMESPNVTIAPLAARAAFVELVRNAFHLDVADTAEAGRRFQRLTRVASLPSLRWLSYPRDLGALPALRQAILADLGTSDCPA